MTSDAQRRPVATVPSPVPLIRRIYGLGSVFGKTLRDSRRATILVGVLLGLVLVGVSKAIVAEFNTPQSRLQLGDIIRSVPPILQGFAGKPVNVETLGGYLQYKYGVFIPIVGSIWSILALSGTLAAEARRGSLEFVAATRLSRRRIALEKLFGHIAAVGIAALVIFVSLALVGTFAVLPGDAISVGAAAGYALWLALLALAAGSLAFALAQFLGRGAALAIAGAVTFGGFVLNGYQAVIPGLAPFANLTWFGWTTNHIPLAGVEDWASLIPVAIATIVFLAIGVEAFVRRDIGATSAIPTPSLPRPLVGLRGPGGRTFGNNVPSALAWGIGIGFFGLVIAGSGSSFAEQLNKSPDFRRLLSDFFPGVDIGSVGGFLQLVFLEFGFVLAGLAASTVVSGWASDETSGRLEMLLATPLSRRRWVVEGGLGVFGGLAVVTALAMVGIAIGAMITGGDVATPIIGTLSMGLFAVAMAGVGVAVGGVFGGGLAAPATAVVTIVTWFIDIVAPAFKLPDVVHQLALSSHFGLPMLGHWDAAGVVASIVLGVGGLAIGAWGFARRDLRG
jgi:ABC-2 type transport system permease protein